MLRNILRPIRPLNFNFMSSPTATFIRPLSHLQPLANPYTTYPNIGTIDTQYGWASCILISPYHVMTVQHVLERLRDPWSKVTVSFGKQQAAAKKIFLHPLPLPERKTLNTIHRDVAIVELAHPIEKITPASLSITDNEYTLEGSEYIKADCAITGYSYRIPTQSRPHPRLMTQLPTEDRLPYRAKWEILARVSLVKTKEKEPLVNSVALKSMLYPSDKPSMGYGITPGMCGSGVFHKGKLFGMNALADPEFNYHLRLSDVASLGKKVIAREEVKSTPQSLQTLTTLLKKVIGPAIGLCRVEDKDSLIIPVNENKRMEYATRFHQAGLMILFSPKKSDFSFSSSFLLLVETIESAIQKLNVIDQQKISSLTL